MSDLIYKGPKILDAAGERIHWDGPYFDKAARRTFNTIHEKAEYMHKNGLTTTGESDETCKRQREEYHKMKMDTDAKYRKSHETK